MGLTPEEFIAKARWRFAKTMPQIPHEYTTRRDVPIEEFESFVRYIREHGYEAEFAGKTYTYLNVDGWRYWTMGAPLEETTVINRARLDGPGSRS